MQKLYRTETTQQHLSALVDLIGEGAVLEGPEADEFPRAVEDALRKSVIDTIRGGSSEIMREIIAEQHLGLPRNRPGG